MHLKCEPESVGNLSDIRTLSLNKMQQRETKVFGTLDRENGVGDCRRRQRLQKAAEASRIAFPRAAPSADSLALHGAARHRHLLISNDDWSASTSMKSRMARSVLSSEGKNRGAWYSKLEHKYSKMKHTA